MSILKKRTSFILLAALAFVPLAHADDWPTYRHDNQRSGVADETLDFAALNPQWTWEADAPPQPAWHGPAKWDAFSGNMDLRSMRDYDPVYYTIAVGDAVYFASTATDKVYALDAATGAERWNRVVDGAVRIAPTWSDGALYVGTDSGTIYCLQADTGATRWRFQAAPTTERLISNGKMISRWPCRTGVLVSQGTAYFGAALLPWRTGYLHAVNAETGESEGGFKKALQGATLEGALLASATRLYAPQGRSAPLVFQRGDGAELGPVEGGAGVFALLTPDEEIVLGPPSQKEKFVALSNPQTGDTIAAYQRGNYMIVAGDHAYILRDNELMAVQRGTRKKAWRTPCDGPLTLILSGDTLLCGGRGKVSAYATADGRKLGEKTVTGRVYGITVAHGRLYLSSDTGDIYCYK
jgi:outer membrane protein assembly factor BamB